jgi:hypothetical protein
MIPHVGSWFAKEQFSSIFFIFLQFGNYPTNTKSIVNKYKYNPEALTKGLQHRIDLTEDRIELLSQSISFVSCADPFEGIFPITAYKLILSLHFQSKYLTATGPSS